MPDARIVLDPVPPDAVLRLERELQLRAVTAQILVRRGLTDPVAARAFLDAAAVHPPEAFAGIERAVELIRSHVRAGAQITVHGDYDCDGVCSTAVLVECLRTLGADVDWYLPDRHADGYGLALHTVERLAARGTRLLITADCAITAVEEVAAARALGLDVIVTDHHHPRVDGELPDAPIVHPALCGYPCPDLCATAVAAKLAAALRGGEEERDLELVALATVADVVPLRGENRRLVRQGLHALAGTSRLGLRALMAVSDLEPSQLDERALAFRLAPRINAAGRLYRPDAGLELLLTGDGERAAALAAELDRGNAERRHTETRILFEAEAQVAAAGEAPAYVLAGEGWHPGVIGIVAARIAERHHRPAVLIALPEEGAATGSARSIPAFDLLGALAASGEHLLRFGGHRAAAGLQIEPGRIDDFRGAFTAHAERVLGPDDMVPLERIDAVAAGEDVTLELAEELELLRPFGCGNPPPALLLPAAILSDPVGFGGEQRDQHVRFEVRSGGACARAVAFGRGGRLPAPARVPLDATFRLERNEWRGMVEPRLVLRQARACAPDPVMVLGEDGAYLERALAMLDEPLGGGVDGPAGRTTAGLARRTLQDRRDRGIAATIVRLVSSGEPVLVVCADATARAGHLEGRLGGFALCSHATLERSPELAQRFRHIVVLDPPACAEHDERARMGEPDQCTHLAWGTAELRFASDIHEREYGLRASLAALYRSLRDLGGVEGEGLETALRGDPSQSRSPALAGRLLRVLTELRLVDLDRERAAVVVLPGRRATLEHSVAYRAYQRRLEDGRRYLGSRTMEAA